MLVPQMTQLRFLQINSQHKRTACAAIMQEIVDRKIDVALIQEPYISNKTGMIPGIPKGYEQFHNGNSAKSAVIVKGSISCFLMTNFLSDLMVSVKVKTTSSAPLVIVSLYCPPTTSDIPSDFTRLRLSTTDHENRMIIGADVNCHSSMVGYSTSDKKAARWDDLVASEGLILHNETDIKTFCNSRGFQSTIDWTLSDSQLSDYISDWRCDPSDTCLSDHLPIFFLLAAETTPSQLPGYNFNRVDWQKFTLVLEQELIEVKEGNLGSETDVDSFADNFSSILQRTIDRCVPRRTLPGFRNKWWNDELQCLKSRVKKAQRKKSADLQDLRRQYDESISQAKNKAWKKFIQSVEGQGDSFLRYKILCKPKSDRRLTSVLLPSGQLTRSPEETAEELLKHNFPPLARPLPQRHSIFEQTIARIAQEVTPTEPFSTITDEEIIRTIQQLKPGKAPGYDKIPGIVFQKSLPILLPPLRKLFNACISLGYFPSAWKCAKITFIKKPGKPSNQPGSYRPISLLPVASKILEKIIHERLAWHAEVNQWIDDQQYGFRRGISAEHAALRLSNRIYTAFKNRKEIVAVFLDISGAFNRVWHAGLLWKLHALNTPMYLIRVLRSYLTGRSAMLEVDSHSSVIEELSQSCPQGSPLSPLLWNIMLNDLFSIVRQTGVEIQGYADDLVVYQEISKGEPPAKLQTALDAIADWGYKWLVSFSEEKSKAVHFSRLRRPTTGPLKLGNVPLDFQNVYRYLGITFDCKLRWRAHIIAVTKKASEHISKLSAVSRIKWGLPAESGKFIYQHAILPMLLYGAIVWANVIDQRSLVTLLRRTQRLMCLAITRAPRTTATDSLEVLCGLAPIQLVIEERAICQLYGILADRDLTRKLQIEETLRVHENKKTHFSPLQWTKACMNPIIQLCTTMEPKVSLNEFPHPAAVHCPCLVTDGSGNGSLLDADSEGRFISTFYTDASKGTDSYVGTAVVKKNDANWDTLVARVYDGISVFRGELLAISDAVDAVEANDSEGEYLICSDSLSGIQAIKDTRHRDPLIFRIQCRLQGLSARNCSVTIKWVRGHVGIDGNEAADQAAKSVLMTRPVWLSHYPLSFVDVKPTLKRTLREKMLSHWQCSWSTSTTGRFTYELFPIVSRELAFGNLPCTPRERITLMRIASGHLPTNAYLKRISARENSTCPYCPRDETTEHLFVSCPRFASLRYHCLALLGTKVSKFTLKDCLVSQPLTNLLLRITNLRFNA